MNELRNKSTRLAGNITLRFSRSLSKQIDWSNRLIGIIGARGVGKTTLMLQRLKQKYGNSHEALYVSLDDFYFSANSLYQLAFDFRNRGGKCLFVDEVHKYLDWSYDLKNIFHSIPDLNVVFAGSSIIDLLKQDADFCRNAATHNLVGLSFREYLSHINVADISALNLVNLLENHKEIANDLSYRFKPLLHFEKYLRSGYYPSFNDQGELDQSWIEQVLQQTIEIDLNYMEGYDPHNASSMKQLLYIISQNVPFKPNILKLSEKIGIHRNTLVVYLFHLEKAKLIQLLYPSGSIVSILQKPHVIFLNNPNLNYLLSEKEPEMDLLRKTFFMNQVGSVASVKKPQFGDFEVDSQWIFEVGNHKKISRHLKDNPNAYLATDGIEIGTNNIVPLWMFGLLY
jgi:hypothetical protein